MCSTDEKWEEYSAKAEAANEMDEVMDKVRQRREELWEEKFGPESEAAKKYEEAIWGTTADAGYEA